MKFINIGYCNGVNIDKIMSVNNVKSRAVMRKIRDAKEREMVIDATEGEKANSAIFLENGNIVLSIHSPQNIINKINK